MRLLNTRPPKGVWALIAACAVLLTAPGCIMWDGFVPRETVALPASDLGAPRLLASWKAASKDRPGTVSDGGAPTIASELRIGEDGGIIALSLDAVRLFDSSGRLLRAARFRAQYLWTVLLDGAGGIHVAGLHGPAEMRELHVLPLGPLDTLGERAPTRRWECRSCFELAAADFSGNGLDSVVALGVVLNRPHRCEIPMAPCASLIVELDPAGEPGICARSPATRRSSPPPR